MTRRPAGICGEGPTLKALNESIAHWERMASGDRLPGERVGHKHCALCRLFQPGYDTGEPDCWGCPVERKTGKQYCEGTPYQNVLRALARDAGSYESKDFKAAAAAERDFLKSLLPEQPQ